MNFDIGRPEKPASPLLWIDERNSSRIWIYESSWANLNGGSMNIKSLAIVGLALVSAVPLSAGEKKKKVAPRAMLERMESVYAEQSREAWRV